MHRDLRPLFVLAIMGGFLLLIVVTVGPLAGGRGRPPELLPADDAPALADAAGPEVDADRPPPLHDRAWGLHMARNYASLFKDAGSDRPADAEELTALDLSGLTPARLRQLDGQRLRLRVITDSGVWRVGDRDVFEAAMKDSGEDLATVWMYANPDIEDGMTVEAVVRIVRHPTIAVGATTVRAFTEYRLLEAVRR